ncbi:MAG: MBL fold metallo-hydrolase [Bacteroidales bacterium]|nr:MBL fold metallo-hydrolase [Bacteroidales bacterium]MBN2748092.1 MBL fold metallo-hydrolase [Bacteroidales bacterium]
MKQLSTLLIVALLAMTTYAQPSKQAEQIAQSVKWFGQASVKLQLNGKTIYVDPFNLTERDSADIILITHTHGDHLSAKDLALVSTKQTTIVAPADVLAMLGDTPYATLTPIKPNQSISWEGMEIKAVPSYNIVKNTKHPKEKEWVGYILNLNGTLLYLTGDTERIPEMKDITCDIILLPLGQTYTMNSVEEAVDAVLDTKATIAIPIHYGMYEGTVDDAAKFKELLTGKVMVIVKEFPSN